MKNVQIVGYNDVRTVNDSAIDTDYTIWLEQILNKSEEVLTNYCNIKVLTFLGGPKSASIDIPPSSSF